ncbi:MAG: hypothetical protein VX733_09505 [Candidatus Latescibacterota bacterium]|nr:hypothetical protein [Candidatus Latescibacterota bacterium]
MRAPGHLSCHRQGEPPLTPHNGIRIYVDLDDVIAETAPQLLRLLEVEYGRRVELKQMTTWDLCESLSLSKPELGRFITRAHEDELLLRYGVVPGAIECLGEARQGGHEVRIVTGRPTSSRNASKRWLREQGVPYDRLVFADKYGNYGSLYELSEEDPALPMSSVEAMKFGLAIEDSAVTATKLLGLGIPVALYDQPWNRDLADSDSLTRCYSWDDVRRLLNSI